MREEKIATWMAIIGNSLLFIGKIFVGVIYNSIAIISDALNSFTDIIASVIVHISVIVSYKKADREHQFGHSRAQPIAALIVAIFTGIVGFEVITASIKRLLEGGEIEKGIIPIILVLCVLVAKVIMYSYTKYVCKKYKSPALNASAVDHMNDVLISLVVLSGVVLANLGYPIFDPIVAILIGLYIIKSGYDIGKDNIKYLMGEAPSEKMFKILERKAKTIKGVRGVHDISAHYVGTDLEVEVHIQVDKKLNIEKAHDIGKKVQFKLEEMEDILRAFVHIDPFTDKKKEERKF